MTKHAIIVDFDGALLKSRPFDIAHKEWFRIMAELLRDQAINEYAFMPDYFEHVKTIMTKYLGDIGEDSKNIFARNIYAMCVVEAIKKWDLVDEFAEHLRNLKKRYVIVLITTTPSLAVDPILKKINCKDIFDIIIKSPMEKQPSKMELFDEYIKKYGKPEFYIGKGDKELLKIKELGIKTISVNWVTTGEFRGNFEASKVEEIDKILERYRYE